MVRCTASRGHKHVAALRACENRGLSVPVFNVQAIFHPHRRAAEGLRILTKWPVRKVEMVGAAPMGHLVLHGDGGRQLKCKRAIVTASLGVLKVTLDLLLSAPGRQRHMVNLTLHHLLCEYLLYTCLVLSLLLSGALPL